MQPLAMHFELHGSVEVQVPTLAGSGLRPQVHRTNRLRFSFAVDPLQGKSDFWGSFQKAETC